MFRWDLRNQSLIETVQRYSIRPLSWRSAMVMFVMCRSMAPILSLALRRDAWTPALSSTEVPLSTEPAPPPADGTATETLRPAVSFFLFRDNQTPYTSAGSAREDSVGGHQ